MVVQKPVAHRKRHHRGYRPSGLHKGIAEVGIVAMRLCTGRRGDCVLPAVSANLLYGFGQFKHWFRVMHSMICCGFNQWSGSKISHCERNPTPELLKPPQVPAVLYNARGRHSAQARTQLILLGVVLGTAPPCGCACGRPHTGVSTPYGRLPDDGPASHGSPPTGPCRDALETVLDMSAVWDLAYAFVTLCACAAL